MEHVTTALYMAGALGVFMLAMTLLMWYGRGIDRMYQSLEDVQLPGQVTEESWSGDE